MMRANASPTAPYYAVCSTPAGTATDPVAHLRRGPQQDRNVPLPVDHLARLRGDRALAGHHAQPGQTFFSTLTSTDGDQLDAGARLHPGDQHGHAATWPAWRRRRRAAGDPAGDLHQRRRCRRRAASRPASARPASPAPTSAPTSCRATRSTSPAAGRRHRRDVDHPGRRLGHLVRTTTTSGSSRRASRRTRPTPPTATARSAPGWSPRPAAADPWMKTGVMIRSSATDPQAPYYGVFVTPAQRRRRPVARRGGRADQPGARLGGGHARRSG